MYFALSFLGNMAMLTAAYFIAREKPVPEGEILGEQNLGSEGAPIKIGAAFIFVSVSSCLAWICNYAYYSVFGHPWEAFLSSRGNFILIIGQEEKALSSQSSLTMSQKCGYSSCTLMKSTKSVSSQ